MNDVSLENKWIGQRTLRPDGIEKVTGSAQYAADFSMPGMVWGKVLRSPHAHAVIKKIDTSKAEKLKGVLAVMTGDDLPLLPLDVPLPNGPNDIRWIARGCMAREKVLYTGHPVAAVAAASQSVAMAALKLIEVDYDVLPHVIDVDEAMAPDAPILHDWVNTDGIDGPTNISVSDDQVVRFKASNWNAFEVDGHDIEAVTAAIEKAKSSDKPTMIACKTTIGFGAPTKAGKSSSHGAALGVEEIAGAREALNWPHAPFEIPDDIRANWSAAGSRSRDERGAWEGRLAANKDAAEFTRRMKGELPTGWEDKVAAYKAQLLEDRPTMATRAASGKALEVLFDTIPEMVGGSADLTGSNLTKAGKQGPLTADNYLGRYIYYGVREHGMAAAMNGIVLHGGFIPYGGTFMVFTDYCRPSIRLSALMNQRVIYVMTHDSIGLGEDGPTHQPVEHLAALRAIPNLNVFRPCDALETMECWEAALKSEGPSVLVLSRQNAPFCRVGMSEDWADLGAFILSPASEDRQATLLASGTEVSIALDAQKVLEADGIPTAVVSMPCWEKFLEQPPHYREEVIRWDSLHVAVEAAGSFGWDRWIGRHGTVIGVEGFGASAPAEQLYEHFGITVDGIVNAVKSRL